MTNNSKEPTTFERLKLFYHSVKVLFFNDEKYIGKHIIENTDKKEFLKYVAEGLFSKVHETPKIGIGYRIDQFGEEKELWVYTTVKRDWQRTFLGIVKEEGCRGGGFSLIYDQPLSDLENADQIIDDNLEEIAQKIYRRMPDGKSIKYQLTNGCRAPRSYKIPKEGEIVPIEPEPLNPLPDHTYTKLEKQLKKLVKTKN